jgi:superfamily II RNA helicase
MGPDGEPVLDPWQKEVFDALQAGESVIVDAPTTAGKTRAVEAFFRANLGKPTFRAAYTTPVKSLSNDKLREFREMFGAENVGIATGDVKENLGAPIVVATLESYRNSLLGVEPDLGRTLVVFDEYHYLQDDGRGSAWEESAILTPRNCQMLMLSASVANAEEFAAWLESFGDNRRCRLVRTERRPVPLVHLVWMGGDFLLAEEIPEAVLRRLDRERMETPLRQEDLCDRLVPLVDKEMTPCIVYAGRRLACETLASALVRRLPPIPEAQADAIGRSLQQSHAETGALQFVHPKLRHMMQVFGVAYHHSGLAAPARMAVESLVKQGLLRFCSATMGLSLGINFAVRSAVISDYERPGELGFTNYSPSEVLQMLGRAGRRGRDVVGFSLWPTPEAYHRMGNAKREPTRSKLRHDPTTFLGLVGRGYSLRAVERFYNKSFRKFQDKKVGDEMSQELAALHAHLHKLGALDKNENLTALGSIARYFPQSGGLVMARWLADGKFAPDGLVKAAELAACLALARFKEPNVSPTYRFPFNANDLEDQLIETYPYEMFEEVYDKPYGRRTYPQIREFNPEAGYIARAWATGIPWKELIAQVTTEQYGTGDVMSLLYRVATYIQSIAQAGIPELKQPARELRDLILREPLSFVLDL